MNSYIVNKAGQQVEQIALQDTCLTVSDLGGGVQQVNSATVILPLKLSRQYEIHRITFMLLDFAQISGASVYSFPCFEQFVLSVKMTVSLSDAAGSNRKDLFSDFYFTVTDGSLTVIFKEPFVFQTDSSSQSRLRFLFENVTSNFYYVSNIAPAPAVTRVQCLLSVEGVSYNIPPSSMIGK